MLLANPLSALAGYAIAPQPTGIGTFTYTGNPLIRDHHTADPASLVVGDTLYLYVRHDEARSAQMFIIGILYEPSGTRAITHRHGPTCQGAHGLRGDVHQRLFGRMNEGQPSASIA